MGADLITAVAVWPKDSKLDFDAGKKVAKTIVETDVDRAVLDGDLGYDLDYDDNGSLTPEGLAELRESLVTAIDAVRSMTEDFWRNTARYTILGHHALILGDMSWGDAPEGYSELIAVLETPKVAKAIGFNLDAYE